MTLEAYERLLRITRIGNRAVRKAQEENRKKGIPNVYARNGKPYWELPDGTITTISPFEETGSKHIEEKAFQPESQKLDQNELMAMIQLTTSWHEKGRAEGYLEGKSEVVKNMLAKNLAVDLIAEVTGFSKDQINKIKGEMAGNIQ